MRTLTMVLLSACFPLLAQTADEKDAVATVQRTFQGMAAHDIAMIRSTMLADAKLYSVRDQDTPRSTAIEDFLNQIAAASGDLLERFTSEPKVFIRARMALVWGEYEFLRDGQFHHCGVDSVSLIKTAEGWKIAAIVYTVETTGCKGH